MNTTTTTTTTTWLHTPTTRLTIALSYLGNFSNKFDKSSLHTPLSVTCASNGVVRADQPAVLRVAVLVLSNMRISCPGRASSATLGRRSGSQGFHVHYSHGRPGRCSLRVHAKKAQDKVPEQSSPASHANGNGTSNGASNSTRTGLISSNNGVVLDRKGGSLEDRISSGEFSRNQGSFKEKASRPVRQVLAKDPLGPGSNTPPLTACVA